MSKNEVKESDFIDPDEFAIRYLEFLMGKITQAIDYRKETLGKAKDRFLEERLDELELFHRYIETMKYEKGSWKSLFPEEKDG